MNKFHFIPILITLFHFNLAFAQESDSCAIPNSTPIPLVPEGCFLQDGSNADDFIVSEWLEDPEIFDTTVFLVTAPESEGISESEAVMGEFIIGSFTDGSFDFSDSGEDFPYETGIYKITPFSFNQNEMNDLAHFFNSLVPLVSLPPIQFDQNQNARLSEFLRFIGAPLGDIRIEDLEFKFCDLLENLGYSFTYGLGETYERSVVSSLEECQTVGIEDPTSTEFGITKISPIPAVDNLSIDFISTNDVVIQLSDIAGKVITESNAFAATTNLILDVSNYPPGIYFARLSDGRNVAKQKFIVN